MTEQSPTRALNSSSNFGRRFFCPGSAHAELMAMRRIAEGLAPSDDSDDAAEGTLLHHHDAHPELSRDDLSAEQRAVLERNAEIRNKFIAAVKQQYGIPDDAKCVEIRDNREFWLMGEDGLPWVNPLNGEGFPGHPDVVLYFPSHRIAIIFDSKFGRKEVAKAECNYQLRSYVIMVYDNYQCDMVVAAITQPRFWDYFHSVVYTAPDVELCRQEALKILAATVPQDAPRKPSEEACTYCKAKAVTCPESMEIATNLAVEKIDDLTPAELEALAPEIKLASKVIDAWEKRMKFIAKEHPELLEKFTLGKQQFNRNILDPSVALDKLIENGLLNSDYNAALTEFFGCCKASRPDIIDFVAKRLKLTKENAETRVDAALGDLIEKKPKERSLVAKKP